MDRGHGPSGDSHTQPGLRATVQGLSQGNPRHSTSGQKGKRGKWEVDTHSQPYVSLVPTITDATKIDDRGFNKLWVKSRIQNWSGIPALRA